MQDKQFLKTFVMTFVISFAAIVLLNYIYDPLLYYHYSAKRQLNNNDRLQVAGILRSFDYNQIILGTSMTQNFSAKLIHDVMGTKAVRLSIAGCTIQEQAIVLQAALNQKKLKSVIWGIDRCYLNYKRGSLQPSFPVNLYQQNLFSHLHYLLNINITHASIKGLNPWRKLKLSAADIDKYNVWDKEYVFSKALILKLYNEAVKNAPDKVIPLQKTDFSEDKLKETVSVQIDNFNQDVLRIISENPEIHFDIFFPPYSLAQYKSTYLTNPLSFSAEAYLRHYIYKNLMNLPNVSIHDFEVNLEIVANLDNYKDLVHYSKDINALIIHKMKSKSNLLTADKLQANHEAFLKLPSQSFL